MPRRFRSFLLLVFLPVCILVSRAQSAPQSPPAAPVRDPQAILTLQNALLSLGGSSPSSILATATYTRFHTDSAPAVAVQIKALGVDSFRWDFTDTAGTVTLIINNSSGVVQDATGARALSVGGTLGRGGELFPALLLTRWLANPLTGAQTVGLENVEGKTLTHLTIIPAPPAADDATGQARFQQMARCEFYADPQTNLPARLRVYQSGSDWRLQSPVDLDFADFRTVSGVVFPFSISFSIGGRAIAQIKFQSIIPNAPVSSGDFQVQIP